MVHPTITIHQDAVSPIFFSEGEDEQWTYTQFDSVQTQETTVWKESGIIGVISYLVSVVALGVLSLLDLVPEGFNPSWNITHTIKQVVENYVSSEKTKMISDEMATKLAHRLSPVGVGGEKLADLADRIQGANTFSTSFGAPKRKMTPEQQEEERKKPLAQRKSELKERREYRRKPTFRITRVYNDGVLGEVFSTCFTKAFDGEISVISKKIASHKPELFGSAYEMQGQLDKKGESGGIEFYTSEKDLGLPRSVAVAACKGLSKTEISPNRLQLVVGLLNRDERAEKSLFAGHAGKINIVMGEKFTQAGVSISLGNPSHYELGECKSIHEFFSKEVLSDIRANIFPGVNVHLKVEEKKDGEVVVSILSESDSKTILARELKEGMSVYAGRHISDHVAEQLVSGMSRKGAISTHELLSVYRKCVGEASVGGQDAFLKEGSLVVLKALSGIGSEKLGVEFNFGEDVTQDKETQIRGLLKEEKFANKVELTVVRDANNCLVVRVQDKGMANKISEKKPKQGVKASAYSSALGEIGSGHDNKRAQGAQDIQLMKDFGLL